VGDVGVTPAVLLAALAGIVAAAALVDAAAAWHSRDRTGARRRPRRVSRALVAVLGAVGRRAGTPDAPTDLRGRLLAAGVPGGVTVEEVMALKAGAALAALLTAGVGGPLLPGRLGLVMLAAGPAAGFLAPDLWLRRRARVRGAAMAAELPDVADLLRVAVDAGLPVRRALREVGRRRAGRLAAELARAASALELGLPRAETLAVLRARCPAEGVAPLVAALERAERHGAPLGPALAALAADARARDAQRVRDAAARAAPKIQLAVALLLVPAVMLLVAAALLAGLT
jgi:tight adherence protein C